MSREKDFNKVLENLLEEIQNIRIKCEIKPMYFQLLAVEEHIAAFKTAPLPQIELLKEISAFFDDVQLEHAHAVTKYPAPNKNLAALVEEVGEVARALLENKPREQLYNECVQVATMAVRIAMEAESI